MLTMNLLSPSLKSRWRSLRASRNLKRQRRIYTRHSRLGETKVCRKFGICSRTSRGFLTSLFSDMAAGMERLSEYKTYNSQFCRRVFDFLSIMFTAQVPHSALHVHGRN